MTTSPTTKINRQDAHSIAVIGLFAAMMAVLGLIPKFDLPMGVHFSAQTIGVMIAGCLLGAKRGSQSMLLFLLAIAVGLPLLAGGRGGLGVFVSPTSGYLIGFAVGAFVTGLVMSRLPRATPTQAAVSAFIASIAGGLIVLHAMGIVGLMVAAKMPLMQAITIDLVFIPGDIIKAVVTALIVHAVAKGLPDWPLGGRADVS